MSERLKDFQDWQGFVVEDKCAQLESALIEEYLHKRGYTLSTLHQLPEEEARRLRTEICLAVSVMLEEMKDKEQLVQALHGASEGT